MTLRFCPKQLEGFAINQDREKHFKDQGGTRQVKQQKLSLGHVNLRCLLIIQGDVEWRVGYMGEEFGRGAQRCEFESHLNIDP